MTLESTFYDNTPFNYGYSSKENIIANMHPYLKKLMEKNMGKTFCDIGCGCGRNLLYATNYAGKLIGVDLSKKSLDLAKEILKSDKIKLIQGDNLDLPLDSEIADLVISDGVCHHTGNTKKAFSECVRILKPEGYLFLAVYKKFRYYPLLYFSIGGLFRFMNKVKLGNFIIENLFINIHYIIYRLFKNLSLLRQETRNIFYDYFMTPIVTFHSKFDVNEWCVNNNCSITNYSRTSGNCHVFVIKKNV